jgi:hypothetical protein
MTDRRNYEERLRDELHGEYSRLSKLQTGAWVLIGVSAAIFISNMLGVDEPTNRTLGAIALGGVIGGGVWLHTLRSELTQNLRRSIENTRELDTKWRNAAGNPHGPAVRALDPGPGNGEAE